MAGKLARSIERIPGIEPVYVFCELEDYARFPAPPWVRATDSWHSRYLARRKAGDVVNQNFGMMLVNTWELAVEFRDVAARIPAAAILDATPANFDAQLRLQGAMSRKRKAIAWLHKAAFGRAARRFELFLPMGSDSREALLEEYRIDPARCTQPTLAPQDPEGCSPSPGQKPGSGPARLLFVGKDFFRKGGEFLLRLYAERLSETCRLTIVSSDPGLDGRPLPAGVERLSHIPLEQLRDLYRSCDLFVFPTRQDFLPQVLAEALSFGLPCIAGDAGAVKDLVRSGETGWLVNRDATQDEWTERIVSLIRNPGELAEMSARARTFAEKNLSFERFDRILADAFDRLAQARAGRKQ